MDYIQSNTVSSNWSVTVGISVTAKFEVNFLAELGGTFNASFIKGKTTTEGTTISGRGNVSPYMTGTLTAYRPGAYSSGSATYDVYDIQYGNKTGTYNETNYGWAVDDTRMTFEYEEH